MSQDKQPAETAAVEPVQWEVRPAGIEATRFADPETFYLTIRRGRWQGARTFVVSQGNSATGALTKRGAHVHLRHDVNAKHAHHATFEEAVATAIGIADGTIETVNYRTWRQAERAHFAPGTAANQ